MNYQPPQSSVLETKSHCYWSYSKTILNKSRTENRGSGTKKKIPVSEFYHIKLKNNKMKQFTKNYSPISGWILKIQEVADIIRQNKWKYRVLHEIIERSASQFIQMY